MSNAIETAVRPLRQMAADEARTRATETAARIYAEFEAVGWDMEKVGPVPKGTDSREVYRRKDAKRWLCKMLTTYTKATRRMDEPDVRVRSAEGEARFIENAVEAAVASYDAYVAKLISKIGDVETASLDVLGGVWGNSVLTVTKAGGDVERWKTQIIVNCSGLGKLFNQWPTRKIK